MSAIFPFDELPLELQREICLIAANADTASALRLVHVARRVKEWCKIFLSFSQIQKLTTFMLQGSTTYL